MGTGAIRGLDGGRGEGVPEEEQEESRALLRSRLEELQVSCVARGV